MRSVAIKPHSQTRERIHLKLTPLHIDIRKLSAYERAVGALSLNQIQTLAGPHRGLRVAHVNATADGGGVAEILRSLVPLLRDVGVDARWYVLPPDGAFFAVTKCVHNWLQGAPGEICLDDERVYCAYLERLAHIDADV